MIIFNNKMILLNFFLWCVCGLTVDAKFGSFNKGATHRASERN